MKKKVSPKELTLAAKDKQIGGVAGGLAEYFDKDPIWLRFLAVILIILSGILPGLIIYGVFYVLMKKTDKSSS